MAKRDLLLYLRKFRKYKPLTAPRKCNVCGQKTVKAAYRTICASCASSQKVCAACGKSRTETKAQSHCSHDAQPGDIRHQRQEEGVIKEVLKGLTERQRRTALRRQERGEDMLTILSQLDEANSSEESDSGDDRDNIDNSGS